MSDNVLLDGSEILSTIESKPVLEAKIDPYTKHYIYVLACGVASVREFAKENCISYKDVKFYRNVDHLRGLIGYGNILYILKSAVMLPDYDRCLNEAKSRGFEIREVE